MNWMARMKIMPLMIVVAALSFGVRFGDFMTGLPANPGVAQAKSSASNGSDKNIPEMSRDHEKAEDPDDDGSQLKFEEDSKNKTAMTHPNEEEPRTVPVPTREDGGEKIEWKDSADSDLEYSGVRMELFEDLSSRREGLEAREREIVVREALLKVAEQEMDQKYKELVSLRSELQDLLEDQSEEEKNRIASLVKIYEGMKPKDAARIFNTLDTDILLLVISQMSERKSAPVMAAMNSERANTVTMMLLEQKTLPEISDGFIP